MALRNGDVVLLDRLSQGWISVSIKLGSKLRYGFANSNARFTHAVMVYDADGRTDPRIIEATAASGVQLSYLSKYAGAQQETIHTDLRPDDWLQVKDYLDDVLEKRTKYGFVTYAGLTLYALTGTSITVQQAGTAICSGLVCEALTRAGWIWRRPPYACSPADISAERYSARPEARRPAGAGRPARAV